MREIARRARVDPALVHHYFDGKAALFAEVSQFRIDPSPLVRRIIEGERSEVGERAVRTFFAVWDSPQRRAEVNGLLRSAVTNEDAARALREFLVGEIFGRIVLAMRSDEGTSPAGLTPSEARRAGLAAAQMSGVAIMRYVIGLPALVEAPVEELVPPLAATLQRYLVPDDDEE